VWWVSDVDGGEVVKVKLEVEHGVVDGRGFRFGAGAR
jgi:hypothetical protein